MTEVAVAPGAGTMGHPSPVDPKDKKPNTDPILDFVKASFKSGALVEAKRNFSGGKGTVGGVDIPAGGYLVKITAAEKKAAPKTGDTKHPDVLPPDEQKKILAAFQDRFVEAGQSEAQKELVAEPRVLYVGVPAAVFDELFQLEVPPPPSPTDPVLTPQKK